MNLHELLLSFPNPPLIPCETAVNLLKIESICIQPSLSMHQPISTYFAPIGC